MVSKKGNVPHNLGPRGMGYRIKVLSLLLSRLLQRRLEPFDLTPFHWLVLNCLWRQDGLAISEIGDKLQQVGGTMTGVLDRMEERGLLTKERDSEDRRIWRAWLTTRGKEFGKTLPPLMTKEREQLYSGIPQADLDCFMSVLEKLLGNADAILKKDK